MDSGQDLATRLTVTESVSPQAQASPIRAGGSTVPPLNLSGIAPFAAVGAGLFLLFLAGRLAASEGSTAGVRFRPTWRWSAVSVLLPFVAGILIGGAIAEDFATPRVLPFLRVFGPAGIGVLATFLAGSAIIALGVRRGRPSPLIVGMLAASLTLVAGSVVGFLTW